MKKIAVHNIGIRDMYKRARYQLRPSQITVEWSPGLIIYPS